MRPYASHCGTIAYRDLFAHDRIRSLSSRPTSISANRIGPYCCWHPVRPSDPPLDPRPGDLTQIHEISWACRQIERANVPLLAGNPQRFSRVLGRRRPSNGYGAGAMRNSHSLTRDHTRGAAEAPRVGGKTRLPTLLRAPSIRLGGAAAGGSRATGRRCRESSMNMPVSAASAHGTRSAVPRECRSGDRLHVPNPPIGGGASVAQKSIEARRRPP